MSKITLKITGTHCKACKMLIEDVMEEIGVGVKSFELRDADNESTIVIETDLKPEQVKEEIEGEGDYTVEVIN